MPTRRRRHHGFLHVHHALQHELDGSLNRTVGAWAIAVEGGEPREDDRDTFVRWLSALPSPLSPAALQAALASLDPRFGPSVVLTLEFRIALVDARGDVVACEAAWQVARRAGRETLVASLATRSGQGGSVLKTGVKATLRRPEHWPGFVASCRAGFEQAVAAAARGVPLETIAAALANRCALDDRLVDHVVHLERSDSALAAATFASIEDAGSGDAVRRPSRTRRQRASHPHATPGMPARLSASARRRA